MPKKTPQHERLSYLVSKSPGIKILENVAFHSMYYFTTAFTLSCCISKIWVFENSQHIPHFLGFQNMMILNLHGILFHAVVVFGPEHDLLFKSASTYCVRSEKLYT